MLLVKRLLILAIPFIFSSSSLAFGNIKQVTEGQITENSAEALVSSLIKEFDRIFTKSDTKSQQSSKFRKVIEDSVEINDIAKFVAGPRFRDMSDEQKHRYIASFKEYIIAVCHDKFREYFINKAEIKVVGSKVNNPNKTDVLVSIQERGKQPTVMTFQCKKGADGFKVMDIVPEGISMLAGTKSEFMSIISNQGVDGLISTLNEKTNRISKQ